MFIAPKPWVFIFTLVFRPLPVFGIFICDGQRLAITVLPRGRNFDRKAQKGPKKILTGPGKSGAELLSDLSKKGRKGAELFRHRPNFLADLAENS
jgi:hypothetical protein